MKTSPYKMLATLALLLSLAAVGQKAQAVVPVPDGCYPNFTTAEGCDALKLLTTGAANTGLGWRSLFSDGTGNFNTGVGAGALVLNNADSNTAVGTVALLLNTTGMENTAVGTEALVNNSTGSYNTAAGYLALSSNDADSNSAFGWGALHANTGGTQNTAIGVNALGANGDGNYNTAAGFHALYNTNGAGWYNTAIGVNAANVNTDGFGNVAVGYNALYSNNGCCNTVLGARAGEELTNGSNNVYIGSGVGPVGSESNTTRIDNISSTPQASSIYVTVETIGIGGTKLGYQSSSRRYKEDIKPMEQTSEILLKLRPVTFRYKKDMDPDRVQHYGLVAEEVADVDPALVVYNPEGKPETLRFDSINAMLLNEFLKEHKAFLEEQHKVQKLEAALAAVNQQLKQQAARIEKVSAGIATNTTALQLARVR